MQVLEYFLIYDIHIYIQDFKDELESVVTDILRSDGGGGHVIAQAIANVFSPGKRPGPSGNF